MAASMNPRQVVRDYERALEKKPSEIDLDNVSKRVGGNRRLLVHLGVPVDKITPLYLEYRNPVDACFFGLVYWRDGNIRNKALTWSVLLEALEEGAERKDYAEDLRKNIVDITNIAEQWQQSVEDGSPTLKGILSDTDLITISKKVNGDGRSFLTHLGLPTTEIKTLREKYNHDPVEICLHGLVSWREGNNKPCRPATWPVLFEALEKGAEKREYARELEEDFVAACQMELKTKIQLYIQAAHDLVQHRDIGMTWFCEAADYLDIVLKHFAGATITGSGLGIAGGVLSVVGGGLLLGAVTGPVGILATFGYIVNNRKTLKQANEWIRQGSKLCRDLIDKHDDYYEVLNWITKLYGKNEKEIIDTTIGSSGEGRLKINAHEFHRADKEVKFIISDWNRALEMGVEATATAFVAGTRVAGAVTRGVVGGVEAGAEAGAAVARVAVQAAGGVVIGLSAVFMVVDLALIGRTAYDLNRNKKGTELAKKLRQAADDMEGETESLRPLAHCAN